MLKFVYEIGSLSKNSILQSGCFQNQWTRVSNPVITGKLGRYGKNFFTVLVQNCLANNQHVISTNCSFGILKGKRNGLEQTL